MVDDVATQGGTLAEMRNYIEAHGGKVVEAVTLATAKGSTYLALEDKTRLALDAKFGIVELDNVLAPFQLATHSLTNSEGRYFLKFGSLTALKSRTASEAEKISLDIQEEVSAIEENRQQELLGFSSEELQQQTARNLLLARGR